MNWTAAELWTEAYPDVPWADASPEDHRLYLDHAASLNYYNLTQRGN